MLTKIQKFIEENKITPRDCAYHTWRDVVNSKDEYKGKVRVLVLKNESLARCEYICPECGYGGYQEKEWKRPFSFKCERCGYLIRISRMRDEIKREKKLNQNKN